MFPSLLVVSYCCDGLTLFVVRILSLLPAALECLVPKWGTINSKTARSKTLCLSLIFVLSCFQGSGNRAFFMQRSSDPVVDP